MTTPTHQINETPGVVDYDIKTISRLFDFFSRRTPWHRRLWSIGTVLSLHEVVEYSKVCREGRLPTTGLDFVATTIRDEIALDPGSAPFSQDITRVLDELKKRADAHLENTLTELAHKVDTGYIKRWNDAIESGGKFPIERTSSLIAAHLLDKGFSPDHLYRWLDADRYKNISPDLKNILSQAEKMCQKDASSYEVIVPCIVPEQPTQLPNAIRWMDSAETAKWIQQEFPKEKGLRQGGAFLITVTERDTWAAVDAAKDLVARIAARIQVGKPGRKTLQTVGVAYVLGQKQSYQIQPSRRQLEIHALDRQGAVFNVDPTDFRQLDDALELASYLETGSAGAAITGGWAAIEGLLMHPGEKSATSAADRLASIVACSVGRAELTSLAFRHEEFGNDDLATSLRGMEKTASNYDRVRLVEDHLREGRTLTLESPSDKAALDRVVDIINEPAVSLDRVRQYAQQTFRRLYNQRNLVMHSGSFRSVALAATLRTAPALVGAGLDRIVHAELRTTDRSLSPLALSASAEVALSLLKTGDSQSRIVDLLGR